MVAFTNLSTECSSKTKIPTRTQHPALNPASLPKEAARDELPFSHLWKGICGLFAGIFKPTEPISWEQEARKQDEENRALRAGLEEKTECIERMEGIMGRQVQKGSKRMHEILVTHVEKTNKNREDELQGLAVLLKRHEEVVSEYLRYKQGYENLAKEYESLKEHNRFLVQQNEELAKAKIEFENLFKRERDKAAMYERAWHRTGDASSSSYTLF